MGMMLVVNPAAGGGTARGKALALARAARELGQVLGVVMPSSPAETGAAVRRSVAEGAARILVAGGDGTVNCAVTALAGSPVPLGIIPVGTVNVLARQLQLPLDPMKALTVALTGPTRRIDLGCANGHTFALMAGLGFDAEVVAEIVPRCKELFRSLHYIATGLQVLARYKPSQFHLAIGGIDLRLPAWLVVVGNASCYTYDVPMLPAARVDDGLLDICVFAERHALDRLTQIGAVFGHQHVKLPSVSYFRARQLTITADPPVHLQLDGDPAGRTPVEIAIQPAALNVVVPG